MIFKRNTPQLAAAGIKGMRIQFRLRSAWPGSNFMRQRLGCPAACGVGALPPFHYIIFIFLFGIFSIFGTYIGYTDSYGSIINIRDLSPIIGGLVAGPYVGLAIGLIGGIHRFFLGGVTCISCSLSTILAGLFAGLIYRLNSEKLLDIIPGMVFAAAVELIHALLALLLVHPCTIALDIIFQSTPQMMIANSLGIAISIIILRNTRELGS